MEEAAAANKKSMLKRVCIFCGSSAEKKDSYTNAAIDLAREMVILVTQALKKLDLVYGGGSIGLMGLVSQTLHHGGGRGGRWVWNNGASVGDHHLGSARDLCKACKAVGLLNVDGFYDGLLRFIERAVEEGIIKPMERHIFVSAPNAKDLLHKLEDYVPAVLSKLKWDYVENEEADACN